MKEVKCPGCNFKGEEIDFGVATKQGFEEVNGFGKVWAVNVGYKCKKCSHEFGFE